MKLEWSTEYKVYNYSAVGTSPGTGTIENGYGNVAARNEFEADELVRNVFRTARGYECSAVAVMLIDLEVFSATVQVQAKPENGPEFNVQAALKLYSTMSAISEAETFAGWLIGTEYSLWDRLLEIPELMALSRECDGWVIWLDNDQEGLRSVATLLDDGVGYKSEDGQPAGPAWISLADWRKHILKEG